MLFREDTLGQYLELTYSLENIGDINLTKRYLARWYVHGRFTIEGNTVKLYTIFPITDENYLSKQLKFSLYEIWGMSNVVKSPNKQ